MRAPFDHPQWLETGPVKLLFAIVVAFYVAAGAGWIARCIELIAIGREPIGHDFIAFWSASYLALAGTAPHAYGIEHILEAHRAGAPGLTGYFLWHYPPTFFLVVLPFALLPYVPAYVLFVAATFAGFFAVLRRLVPAWHVVLLLGLGPAAFINLMHGQNGFVTAALLGIVVLALDRRPVVAGIAIGLLAFKPHWGLLFPIALAIAGRWVAFKTAAVTATEFVAVSVVVLGTDVLETFVANMPLVRSLIEAGTLPWAKMPTVFATVRLAGGSIVAAYALQLVAAALAVALVVEVWRRPIPVALQLAILIAATVLVTPYLFDYDLVALLIPMAILLREGLRQGFLPGERIVLVLAWIAPLVISSLSNLIAVQFGPLLVALLIVLALRRAGYLRGARAAPVY
ncbi:MAG: DUF2029 domain-containing protein [Alphaproteobacteria bacterium]|nr:DUF2029 domain-containing protein [Alphaproteobacteria bacterium]